jgi:hypothetical protein
VERENIFILVVPEVDENKITRVMDKIQKFESKEVFRK